jgi:hypothetical protein
MGPRWRKGAVPGLHLAKQSRDKPWRTGDRGPEAMEHGRVGGCAWGCSRGVSIKGCPPLLECVATPVLVVRPIFASSAADP